MLEDLQDLGGGWTQGRNAALAKWGLFRRPTQRGCWLEATPAKTVATTLWKMRAERRAERSPRLPQAQSNTSGPSRRSRRASFAHAANDNDEISLEEGDVLEDLQDLGDGWTRGRNARTGEVGTFPSAYTEGLLAGGDAGEDRGDAVEEAGGEAGGEEPPTPPSTVKYFRTKPTTIEAGLVCVRRE